MRIVRSVGDDVLEWQRSPYAKGYRTFLCNGLMVEGQFSTLNIPDI